MKRLLVLLLIASSDAQAAGLIDCFVRVFKTSVVDKVMSDFSGRTVTIATEDGPVTMELGKRFGSGYFGSVYPVKSHAGPIDTGSYSGPLAAKFPHSVHGTKKGLWYADGENSAEFMNYERLQHQIPGIEVAKGFPENPAWKKGTLPIIPILDIIPSDHGTVLIKPAVKAMGPKDVMAKYGTDLPADMIRSLREIYDLAQALSKSVPADSFNPFAIIGGKGYNADIRQTNLMWVEDPDTLTRLGLSRPSFILAELTQVPVNLPHYRQDTRLIGQNFDSYLEGYLDYVKAADE